MPLHVLEQEARQMFRVVCDACHARGELAPSAEVAGQAFILVSTQTEGPNQEGCYLCRNCATQARTHDVSVSFRVNVNPSVTADRIREHVENALRRQITSSELAHLIQDSPQARLRLAQAMVTPIRNQLSYNSLARQVVAVDPLPPAALPVYYEQESERPPQALPGWCSVGTLLRWRPKGRIVRVTHIGETLLTLNGETRPEHWDRRATLPFKEVFEQVQPRSRYDHILEDELDEAEG